MNTNSDSEGSETVSTLGLTLLEAIAMIWWIQNCSYLLGLSPRESQIKDGGTEEIFWLL